MFSKKTTLNTEMKTKYNMESSQEESSKQKVRKKVANKGFIRRIWSQGKCYDCLTFAELRSPQER